MEHLRHNRKSLARRLPLEYSAPRIVNTETGAGAQWHFWWRSMIHVLNCWLESYLAPGCCDRIRNRLSSRETVKCSDCGTHRPDAHKRQAVRWRPLMCPPACDNRRRPRHVFLLFHLRKSGAARCGDEHHSNPNCRNRRPLSSPQSNRLFDPLAGGQLATGCCARDAPFALRPIEQSSRGGFRSSCSRISFHHVTSIRFP